MLYTHIEAIFEYSPKRCLETNRAVIISGRDSNFFIIEVLLLNTLSAFEPKRPIMIKGNPIPSPIAKKMSEPNTIELVVIT